MDIKGINLDDDDDGNNEDNEEDKDKDNNKDNDDDKGISARTSRILTLMMMTTRWRTITWVTVIARVSQLWD